MQRAKKGGLDIIAVSLRLERASDQSYFPVDSNQLLSRPKPGAMQPCRCPQDTRRLNFQAGLLGELPTQGVQRGLAELDSPTREPHHPQECLWRTDEQNLSILD